MYLINGQGQKVTLLDMQKAFPNVSFPRDLTDETIAPYGYSIAPPEPPPEPMPPVPPPLSFPQMIAGLVAEGWITKAEGKAWVRGTLPSVVETLIASLPESQQMLAEARAIAPSIVSRTDPLVAALGQLAGRTPEQIDALFYTYSDL